MSNFSLAGPFIGKCGGEWVDAKHTIPCHVSRQEMAAYGPVMTKALNLARTQVVNRLDQLNEIAYKLECMLLELQKQKGRLLDIKTPAQKQAQSKACAVYAKLVVVYAKITTVEKEKATLASVDLASGDPQDPFDSLMIGGDSDDV